VAGLLVVLYAQKVEAISRLTLDHIDSNDNGVGLRLGTRPILLPEPLAALVLDLAASRRGHAVLGNQGTSPWLFPGGQPGRPPSASRLAERLRALGIHASTARSSALLQLATERPAAVIARMLGVHLGAHGRAGPRCLAGAGHRGPHGPRSPELWAAAPRPLTSATGGYTTATEPARSGTNARSPCNTPSSTETTVIHPSPRAPHPQLLQQF
jgi:hypothetical protein